LGMATVLRQRAPEWLRRRVMLNQRGGRHGNLYRRAVLAMGGDGGAVIVGSAAGQGRGGRQMLGAVPRHLPLPGDQQQGK
ncbi:hypothetical protein MY522_22680, partial [Thalassospira xiamenensis]